MNTTLLLFVVLMIGVSSGQLKTGCLEKYDECQKILTAGGDGGADGCRMAKSLMDCFVSASQTCGDGITELWKDFQTLVNDACASGSTFVEDLKKVGDCIKINDEKFKDCTMKGNPSNLYELCDLAGDYLSCISEKEQKACGNSKAFNDVLNPLKKLTTTCLNQTDSRTLVFDLCPKGMIKCGLDIMDPGFKCTDMEKVAKCALGVAPLCGTRGAMLVAIFQPYADRYYKQIPDYCNEDSEFRKNFDKSYQCIMTKSGDITSCTTEYQSELLKLTQSGNTDANQMAVSMAKLLQAMLDCDAQKVGAPCGKEAESAVKYLLQPIREMSDEICIQITKKRCNGACGLMAATWLLLLSLVFLITRYDQ